MQNITQSEQDHSQAHPFQFQQQKENLRPSNTIEETEIKNMLAVFDSTCAVAEKFCTTVATMKGTTKREYFVRRFCPMVGSQTDTVTDFELFVLIQFAQSNGYSIPNGEVILYKRRQKNEAGQWDWGAGVPMPTEEGILRKIGGHPQVVHITRRLGTQSEIEAHLQNLPAKIRGAVAESLLLGVMEIELKSGRVIRGEGVVVLDSDANQLAKSYTQSIAFDEGLALARAAREAYDTLKAIPVDDQPPIRHAIDAEFTVTTPDLIEADPSPQPVVNPPVVDAPPDTKPDASVKKLMSSVKALTNQLTDDEIAEAVRPDYLSITDLLERVGPSKAPGVLARMLTATIEAKRKKPNGHQKTLSFKNDATQASVDNLFDPIQSVKLTSEQINEIISYQPRALDDARQWVATLLSIRFVSDAHRSQFLLENTDGRYDDPASIMSRNTLLTIGQGLVYEIQERILPQKEDAPMK